MINFFLPSAIFLLKNVEYLGMRFSIAAFTNLPICVISFWAFKHRVGDLTIPSPTSCRVSAKQVLPRTNFCIIADKSCLRIDIPIPDKGYNGAPP